MYKVLKLRFCKYFMFLLFSYIKIDKIIHIKGSV